ncbi:efflux RND transporter permease subunit [Algoriphagus sanaruensis]|uniref:SSD domain-containing protein n=1 Tax=Algoriphagus sanaruensis TaxID=1727163 RepID=A0A142ER42_9BACT|nr:MMPL family transporter [Algoriphagus sanaruensis]AMQ57597.1 hypothetical protein AO498_14195 [Algoriphagus sanaruensis]
MSHRSYSFLTLGLGLGLTLLLLIFRPSVSFNYDFEHFFPQDDEDLGFYQEVYEKSFGSDNDYLLLAIGNPNGDLFDLNFLSQADRLAESLGSLSGVDTLISVFDLELPLVSTFGIQYYPVLDWTTGERLIRSKERLSQFYGSLIAKDGSSFLFLVQNNPDLSKEEGDDLYDEIRKICLKAGIHPLAVAGKIQTQGDFVDLMQQEFGLFLGCSLALMLLLLIFIYRKAWGIIVPIVVLLIGILWSFGLILMAGKSLDIMSVMQPTIFLIVGLSALIHYFTFLIKSLKEGYSKAEAIQLTFRELNLPVGLTIFTTSLGFLSLYFTSIPALKSFGLWTGLGVIVMYLALVVLTPGLLYLFSISSPRNAVISKTDLQLRIGFQEIIQHRKPIAFSFLILSLAGIFLGSKVQINGFLLDNLPLNHPIQQDFAYFDQHFGGSNPLELYLEKGTSATNLLDFKVLLEIEKVEKKLSELIGGGDFVSPLGFVKILNQAQNQGNPKGFRTPSQGQYLRMRSYFTSALDFQQPKVLSEDLQSGRISGRAPDFGSLKMGEIRQEFLAFVAKEINPNLLKVRWSGTAYLIDRGHESVSIQMIKGLGLAFVLVGLIAGVLFKSWKMALVLLIPNVIPLVWMFGLMWIMGIELKLTTAILFTVAFGIAVDDTIHFMSKLHLELRKGKSFHYAVKRTFMEAGKAMILTTVCLVSGFGLLIFSQFGVTHFTGLLISCSLIFALLADLLLLPVLLFPLGRYLGKIKAPSHPNEK